jgi:hypothetical protein
MPTLLEYINQLQREHRYRVKMAFQPTDRQLESLERHMKKYDALEVGRAEKLMLQAQPMDFPKLAGHEIVIVDVVTRLPVSPPMLEVELSNMLSVAKGSLKVFGRNEPVEQQMEADPAEGEYKAKVGEDYSEAEANAVSADEAAGDKYNQDMLSAEATAGKERKANITQQVGKITSGPDYTGPADGKTSPIGTKQNKIAIPGKGDKK